MTDGISPVIARSSMMTTTFFPVLLRRICGKLDSSSSCRSVSVSTRWIPITLRAERPNVARQSVSATNRTIRIFFFQIRYRIAASAISTSALIQVSSREAETNESYCSISDRFPCPFPKNR